MQQHRRLHGRAWAEGEDEMTSAARASLSRSWAPHDDEQLKSVIVARRAPAEIAMKLGRSTGAVYARAHRFRLSFEWVKAKLPHAKAKT